MGRWHLLIFRSVGQGQRSCLFFIRGRGGISVLQTSIFYLFFLFHLYKNGQNVIYSIIQTEVLCKNSFLSCTCTEYICTGNYHFVCLYVSPPHFTINDLFVFVRKFPGLDGHVKEPYEMSMAWEPDRRFNFFFNPPAHLCAVTYMTEISLNVTLNNHIHT